MRTAVKGGVTLTLALMLAVSAFAGTKGNSASFDLSNAVQISGNHLAPGSYRLKWEGSGPDVQVQFTQGNRVLATAPAKLVDVDSKFDNTSAVTQSDGQGARSLLEARFGGKKYKLVFGQESTEADKSMKTSGGGDSTKE